jgi:hypothetical protein
MYSVKICQALVSCDVLIGDDFERRFELARFASTEKPSTSQPPARSFHSRFFLNQKAFNDGCHSKSLLKPRAITALPLATVETRESHEAKSGASVLLGFALE